MKRLLAALSLIGAAACASAAQIAEYRFEQSTWNGTAGELIDSFSNKHGRAVDTFPTPQTASPAKPANPGSCGYASFPGGVSGGAFDITATGVATSGTIRNGITFWMYWMGDDDVSPMSWPTYGLWISNNVLGFTTWGGDLKGVNIGPAGLNLANGWHHVYAKFVEGASWNEAALYIDNVNRTGSFVTSGPAFTPSKTTNLTTAIRIGGVPGLATHRFKGSIDEFKVYNANPSTATLTADFNPAHACPVVTTPGGFNAFESNTAAGSITGNIHTKVAATPFAIDVVALNVAQSAVLTTFTGTVLVELLDAHDNSGALNAYGCRSTWTVIPGNAGVTLAFAGADAGRKAATLSDTNAWPDVRVRMSTPSTGAATRIGCSSDNFAIRPSAFASFSASDADWATAGTARSLASVATSGGNVHKAGQPFTIRATAVNAAGTPVATTNYTGSPLASVTACAGAACSASLGAISVSPTALAGGISAAATYSEAGSFALQLNDATFAAVDAADGSTVLERTISSPVLAVGRFVPHHFDLTPLATPVLRTFGSASCAARSFTYLGQPFGYATVPQATVLARNASGATTANYTGSLWKLTSGAIAQTYAATPASPALDTTLATAPALTGNGNGTGLIATAGSDMLKLTRPAAALAPFNANLALTWAAQDASEAGVTGNGTISTTTPLTFSSMAFDAGAQMRFGVLHLTPAYGSELVDLPVPIDAQYWDGLRMATNTADQCSALPGAVTAMSNYQRGLAACETAIATAPAVLTNGRSFLRLAKPGSGNGGSVDLALELGPSASGQTCTAVGGAPSAATAAGVVWLQGNWNGAAAFDQNPSTRATFGLYRSPLVYRRENY